MKNRCPWAESQVNHVYHDTEWGVPSHDDRHLFEMLSLEGAQAGLSWATILNRRETYRDVYGNFDAAAIARYDERKKARLLADLGIVRNRLKIEASVLNARAFLAVQAEFGSFDRYLWASWTGARSRINGTPSRRSPPAPRDPTP